MAIIRQLKKWITKENIYPQPVEQAVYDAEGNRLDNKILGIKNEIAALNSQLSRILVSQKFTTTITFSDSSIASGSINIAKTGYIPIAIASFDIGGNVAAFPYKLNFSDQTNMAWVDLRTYNNAATTASVSVSIVVLYKKA